MFCSQCGTSNESTALFCKNCGAQLTTPTTIQNEKPDILYQVPQQESPNAFVTLLFWSAVAVFIAFFLPWVSFAGFLSYNGWNVSNFLFQAGDLRSEHASEATLYSIMLYLIPVSAIIVIIAAFAKGSRTVVTIFKWLPLIMILVLLGIFITKSKGKIFDTEVMQFLGIGVYLTIISAALLAFSPIPKNN